MATDDAESRPPPAAEPGAPAGAGLPEPAARPPARPTLFRPKPAMIAPGIAPGITPAPPAPADPAADPAADTAEVPAARPLASLVAVAQAVAAIDRTATPAPSPPPPSATEAPPAPAPDDTAPEREGPDREAPATKPAAKPAAEAEVAAEAEAKPAPKPAPKPAAEAAPKPAAKPAAEAAPKPAPKPAAEAARQISPAAKLAVAEAARAAAKALDGGAAPPKPAAKPAEKPAREAPEKLAAPAGGSARSPSAGAVANAARMKRRHWSVILTFLLLVLLPLAASGWYLWTRTADQFASNVSFSVRTSESRSGGGADLLGRLSRFSGTNSTDTDILYQFIQSQELVARIDERLDLRGLYSRHYDLDPVFSFHPDGTIEDLVRYWTRMVRISYDASNGLMALRVLAFEPAEAQRIAQAITDESIVRINDLSATARADATRYATEELDQSVERLRNAREAVTAFRSRNQIVDPLANIQGQMGLLNTLQQQLASALIDLDLLRETARDLDPRITQLERRIEVIRARIAEERSRFGVGGDGPAGDDYATLVGEFERLNVDREFAEQAYRSALMGYDMALAEAERTSRYLAAHITPTLAESSRYPERFLWFGGLALFLLLVWSVIVLIYYSIRDRR